MKIQYMLKKHTILIYFIAFAFTASAQLKSNTEHKNKSFSEGLGAADYSLNIGTSVGTSFNNSYWHNSCFSPSAKFDVSKKFSIIAGIGVSYTQFNNILLLNNDFSLQKSNAQITSFFTYASGVYKLNSKVNVNATVLLDENIITPNESMTAFKKQYKDVTLGVNYNVTQNFSINAQMHISDRPGSRYRDNNLMNFGTNSPFGYTPLY